MLLIIPRFGIKKNCDKLRFIQMLVECRNKVVDITDYGYFLDNG